jgi:ABC-type transport system involved in cytochrome bd biosynthesis fused ATPase/permease subunit
MLDLAKANAGSILIDGLPLERVDVEQWRRRVAFLPQRSYLAPRSTLRECLRFVDPDVTDDVMIAALERVGLHALLARTSSSPLDGRVDEVSAGQRQRIALARVLCRKAPLLLLDEPDANLDRAGIQLVADLLVELVREQRMVIVAAHSAELLAVADRTIRLDGGRVVCEA